MVKCSRCVCCLKRAVKNPFTGKWMAPVWRCTQTGMQLSKAEREGPKCFYAPVAGEGKT